jgi:hypothetical protein
LHLTVFQLKLQPPPLVSPLPKLPPRLHSTALQHKPSNKAPPRPNF